MLYQQGLIRIRGYVLLHLIDSSGGFRKWRVLFRFVWSRLFLSWSRLPGYRLTQLITLRDIGNKTGGYRVALAGSTTVLPTR